jgi:hypothetical protein
MSDDLIEMMKTISDFGTCPAFDCKCEYVSMVEAQAAEIDRLRLECQAQYDRGYYDGRQNDGAEERAKIVAWLRENEEIYDWSPPTIAAAIIDQEHLG